MAGATRGGGWRRLLQLAVSAAAVWLIARTVDLGASVRVLGEARVPLVVGAIALYLVGQVLSAWRWRIIGASVGLGAPFRRWVRWYFVGMFFMFFGPSTLGGDLVRGPSLGEATRRRALAFNSVLLDRLNGLVVLVVIGAVAFLLFPDYGLPRPLLWVTVALGASLLAGWWLAPVLLRLVLPASHRLRRFVEVDLGPFWRDRGMLAAASGVSLVFHLVQIAAQWVVSRALGLPVPFSYICVFHPLVSAFSAIPISLSGIGLREGGYLYALRAIGIDEASAVAYGVLWLLVIVINSLIGGLVFLASGARLPSLRA